MPLPDVARPHSEGKRRRLRRYSNLCVLEWAWTISWKSTHLCFFHLPSYHLLHIFAIRFHFWPANLSLFSTVLLWGSIRFSEVHQGCTSSRTLCSSPNRTLCLRWMEFWVNSSFLKYLNNVYPSESFFIFWILLFCFQFGVLLKISFFWLIMLQWFPCLAQICTWYGVQDRQSTI